MNTYKNSIKYNKIKKTLRELLEIDTKHQIKDVGISIYSIDENRQLINDVDIYVFININEVLSQNIDTFLNKFAWDSINDTKGFNLYLEYISLDSPRYISIMREI